MFDPQQVDWHFFHVRKRSPLLFYIFQSSPVFLKNDVGFDYRFPHIAYFCDNILVGKLAMEEAERKSKHLLETDSNSILRLMNKGQSDFQQVLPHWQNIQTTDFSTASRQDCAQVFVGYIESILPFGVYTGYPLFAESYLTIYLQAQFSQRFGDQAEVWFGVATDPLESGTVMEERVFLLRLAVKARQGEGVQEDLQRHADKFCWMKNVSYLNEFYPVEYYAERLEQERQKDPEVELVQIEQQLRKKRQQFNELLDLIADDSYLQTMVRTANQAVYFRSFRTEIFYSSGWFVKGLLERISQLLELEEVSDVVYLFPDETISALRTGRPEKAELKRLVNERKKGYVAVGLIDEPAFTVCGHEAIDLTKTIPFQTVTEDTQQISGQAAFAGIVEGMACVVHSLEELSKVTEGSILVTHATNVNFVPVLRKVKGMVTEEGGILSHAAVISRELHIPAVIGTKVATQVIRDGDMIQIDSTKGQVTVLKRV